MTKPILLHVEDNAGDRTLVQEAITAIGYECALVSVENAVQAFAYLLRRPPFADMPRPDLILLDLNLPVIRGHDFLREVKSEPAWRSIPVVVLSSAQGDQDLARSAELGAVAHLPKPMEWDGYVASAHRIARECDRCQRAA